MLSNETSISGVNWRTCRCCIESKVIRMNLDRLDKMDERLDQVQGGIACVGNFDEEAQVFLLKDMARELRGIADEMEMMASCAGGF